MKVVPIKINSNTSLYIFEKINGIFIVPENTKFIYQHITDFEWNRRFEELIERFSIPVEEKRILEIEYYIFERGYQKLKNIDFIDMDSDEIIESFDAEIFLKNFYKKYNIQNKIEFTNVILNIIFQNTGKDMQKVIDAYDFVYLDFIYTIDTYYGL